MDIREWTERTFAAWNARDQDDFDQFELAQLGLAPASAMASRAR